MIFANRLFTASFALSLWIAFLGWRPWREMWAAVVVFLILTILTGMVVGGDALAKRKIAAAVEENR